MAKYDMNINNIMLALQAVQALPDEVFTPLMNEDTVTAIINQVYVPIHTRNTHLNADDTKRLFGIGSLDDINELKNLTPRELAQRTVVFYKARFDITPDRNKGALRKATQCFGMGDKAEELINSICERAGIKRIPQGGIGGGDDPDTETSAPSEPKPKKTDAQEKDKRAKRMQKHKTGELPVQPVPTASEPQSVPAQQAQVTTAEAPVTSGTEEPVTEPPAIGTAFPASGLNFVLYKPSEAYQKPARKAVIENYFYDETISMFYGQAGSYKTFWAVWEGISFTIGKELCGMPIDAEPQKVLYISLEMTAKDIADRLHKMTKALTPSERKTVDENFTIISAEDTTGMRANSINFLSALEALCKDKGFNIIYIDSFADYVAGCDIRNETSMGDVISALREFTLKNHVSFRIIHHGTKPTQDYSGSMAGIHTIRDLVDQVYLVKASDTQEVTVTSDAQKDKSAKSRHGKAITLLLKFLDDNESFSFMRIQETETASHIERYKRMISTIEENQGISAGDLKDKMGNGKDLSKMIADAISAGAVIMHIEKSDRGSARKCHYTADYYHEYIERN